MLEASGGTINAIDAHGHVVKTLVTAPPGQTIVNAQLLEDHRTLWYATKDADNQACPAVMKLDLQTNTTHDRGPRRRLLDYARRLRAAARLALERHRDPEQLPTSPYPSNIVVYDGAFVMRNLSTGVQNTMPLSTYPTREPARAVTC